MPTHAFTIRKLADAAGVGVETVRYYQRRGLLKEPKGVDGGFREYSRDDVQRLSFIRRGLDLGFSLDDIAELMSLSALKDQVRAREVAHLRASEIRQRAAQLASMARALDELVERCTASPKGAPCPVIASLVGVQIPAVTERVAA